MESNPQPNHEWLELSPTPQALDELDHLMIGFQSETREMTREGISIWKAKLSEFKWWEVRDAMSEFIATAKREEARGVVLGDLLALIHKARSERARKADEGSTQDKMAKWEAEMRADMQADPEGFEQAKAAFREKWKEIAARKCPASKAADAIDALDVKS